MRRRDFIRLIGGAAVTWPRVARAQQAQAMRRIGVLMSTAADDEQSIARYLAFQDGLKASGWTDGQNIRIDVRWSAGDANRARQYATELVALAPDVILVNGTLSLGPLLQVTHSVPIVFALVTDPVGSGFVDSLSRPGGNVTGFMSQEYSLSAKWLQLLKEIAPNVERVAVLRAATLPADIGEFAVIQYVAASVGVEPSPINVLDATEIERSVAAFARSENGGLIVLGDPFTATHRHMIIALAARFKLPAVYPERFFAKDGGLISYGPNFVELFRSAAGYVDRILRGAKPADLPVQAPTKNLLVINLKTAKTLGLTIPTTVEARADEVIE
jgi:putative ABC transport system substrate-binding protein